MVRLRVNGTERMVDAAPGRSLLAVLRDELGLTGAKYGCGEGRCGACTVLVDGRPVTACTVEASETEDADVTTVEGLAAAGRLHPVQQAFVDTRALQCGYCTPGMVVAAAALLARDPAPDDAAIIDALDGNVCRCGGYPRIVDAVRAALREAASGEASEEASEEASKEAGAAVTGIDAGEPAATWTVRLPPLDAVAEDLGWGWTTPGGAWLTIDDRGRARAHIGKVDGGQGNRYALGRLVAAELGVPTSAVELVMGDTASSPYDLGTFGSRSTPDAGPALRVVAAGARRALVTEAATRWEIPAERLTAAAGLVSDTLTGREIGYGELVAGGSRDIEVTAAGPAGAAPAGAAALDDDALRRGLTAAVTGAKRFPSDLSLPGMLHGRVLRPPAHGSVARRIDTAAARALPGVTVVEDGGFVGVLAARPELASEALRAVEADWGPGRGPAEAELTDYLRAHPVEQRGWGGAVDHTVGDVDAACDGADVVVAATYTTPYIAHVPLEPRVALARPDGDTVTVWTGTQRPFNVRAEVAAALGLPEHRVRVVVPDFGGGFGGKHGGDVAVEAARLAVAAGRPVRVAWTREEEFRHAYFRPAAVIDVRSAADRDGTLRGWEFTNVNSGGAAVFSPYRAPNERVRFQPADSPLPQGSYRALAATANNFARESHVDELAAELGIDPVDWRLRHLRDERLADVLATLAERVGWSRRPVGAHGSGLGIACGLEKDARVATAAEVSVDAAGRLELRRIVTAFDCGAVVDPQGLRIQIVGATIMGLGGALFEAIHFDRGRITNANLGQYRVPRFGDVPPIDVVLIDRPDVPSAGAGETPIIAVAPAIANAIHAATGRRIRSLPLTGDETDDGTVR